MNITTATYGFIFSIRSPVRLSRARAYMHDWRVRGGHVCIVCECAYRTRIDFLPRSCAFFSSSFLLHFPLRFACDRRRLFIILFYFVALLLFVGFFIGFSFKMNLYAVNFYRGACSLALSRANAASERIEATFAACIIPRETFLFTCCFLVYFAQRWDWLR